MRVPVRKRATTEPADLRRATRILAAIVLPIGPACIAVVRYVLPYFTAESAEESIALIAAEPGRQSLTVWLGTLAMFTLIPAVIWVGRVTRRSAPRLTAAALLLLVPGYISIAGLVIADGLAWYGVTQGYDTAILADLFENGHPHLYVLMGAFVLGHVVGSVLLGMAMIVTPDVPTWAGVLVAVSQPSHFVSFVILASPLLDGLSWGANAVGFAAASLVILRLHDDEWDLPPVR